jgi:PqqD family protein of HPr-rel-A system
MISPHAHLLECAWDDGGAIYDARSGDTHLLTPLTLAVLRAARQSGSTTTGTLATHVDVLCALDHCTAAERHSRIESAIEQLLAVHLL